MKIGILGTGDVGKALGTAFVTLGHDVMLAGREANNPKAKEWASHAGAHASVGTFEDAARFGELVVLATQGVITEEVIRRAGPDHLAGKIVWDATNPLDASKGYPALVGGLGTSQGEKNQAAAPKAHVVKVFNTVGNGLMFQPKLEHGILPDMFICGNDADAKKSTAKLLEAFGWNTVDIGGIGTAHYLEAMCLVWVLAAMPQHKWRQAFKLVPAV